MKRIVPLAAAGFLAATAPARAEPISAAVLAVGAWWATLGVTGQILVQVGIAIAAFGLQYLLAGAGQRQTKAQQESQGTQLAEFDSLLEARRCYGEVALAGGVFFA